jgi:hypothetical protein
MVFVALCVAGCGVLEEYEVSVPEAVPPGFVGEVSGATIQLQLPDLWLTVEIQNYRSTGNSLTLVSGLPLSVPLRDEPARDNRTLLIWLALTPIDGKETFTFDASRIILKVEGGEQVEATDFIGPSSLIWTSPRAVARGCGPRRYSAGIAISRMDVRPEDIRTPRMPVTFQGQNCFVLRFNTSASPERKFALSIEGVRKAGQPIRLPEIRYGRGLFVKSLVVP